MSAKRDKPQGFPCECGQYHGFSLYVLAHWDIPLTHTCPKCKAVHYVLRGKVQLVEKDEEGKK